MNVQYLIRHGVVVDGTGSPPYRGDVRVSGGQITEIGATLQPSRRERVIDASDCYVSPGFIETHNHWDGGMWWSPMLEPFAAYGVTTSINGNCGFSLAPLSSSRDTRPDIVEIFNFFEDIPEKPMLAALPWDWRKWSEYRASLQRNVRATVNLGSFCGHIATRLAVMGPEAWERAATTSEIEKMCELLEDALSAGAMGMSSNLLDHDKWDRPLPSMRAEDEEWLALMRVIARHPGATLEVIVDNFMRQTGPQSTERMGRLAKQAAVRMQWVGMPTLKFQAHLLPQEQELHERFKAQKLDLWTGYHHVAPTLHINFGRSLLFAQQGNQVWQEVVNEPDEQKKLAMLVDPEWRRRARGSWDGQYAHTVLNDPTALTLRESQTGQGPVGITLAQYMAMTGTQHPSDALAEWVADNGPESAVLMRTWETDDELLLAMFRDPRSVGNISDAGAHGKMFCGTGDNILLLTDWVRDRQLLRIEEAVHVLTGKLANFFGLHNRGTLEVGQQADLTVFNLAEIERRPEIKLWDVPDGTGGRTFRYTRAPAPMRLTMVNGVPTFDHGEVTGNFPGEFVSPKGGPSRIPDGLPRHALRA